MKSFTVTDLWDFCLLFLGTFSIPIFTKVQALISKCDTEIFCMIGMIFVYIVILVIKKNITSKQ